MTNRERLWGGVLLAAYLWALPLCADPAFALLHVWQFAAAGRDPAYLLPAVQYVVPGLVLAWTYERSGTLWGSVLVHSIVNGISAARLL